MNIPDKLLKAYFKVAEALESEPEMSSSKHYFHRTKKVAFSVMAERLDKNGLLEGEGPLNT